ncbi:MAG: phage tail assembly protein [Chthoniobacteraceae bacterium]|jgi:hypothetical protein
MKTEITIPLKYPVGDVSALTMRRPRASDVLAATARADDETDEKINLVANLCMVSPETIGELDAADFGIVDEALAELIAFEPVREYQAGQPIALGIPITIAGGTLVETVKLCRPKVKDIREARKANGSEAAQEFVLFATLGGVGLEEIKALDWADYLKLKAIYSDLLA